MTSSHKLVKKELEEKSPSTSPIPSTEPRYRPSPSDNKMLHQDLAGPQIILEKIDEALKTLDEYVTQAKASVSKREVSVSLARLPSDSLVTECKNAVGHYLSMSDESIKLTNDKIRIVSNAIFSIQEMRDELGKCEEFTVEHINDNENPITTLLIYLFILISEHSEILKQVFIDMNINKLGETLGKRINSLLAKPLQHAAEYAFSGSLDKSISSLTDSLTLTFPIQAHAAKQTAELLKDEKNTLIVTLIEDLDLYIKATSKQLNNDNVSTLTRQKLKLTIDLRTKLKQLTQYKSASGSIDLSSTERLQQIIACVMKSDAKHNELTGEVLPAIVSSYSTWLSYLFGRLLTPLSQYLYKGRIGNVLSEKIHGLNTQYPTIAVEAEKTLKVS